MEIKLNHHFKHICYDTGKLLNKVEKLSQFMKNLNAQSLLHPDNFKPEKYKGDAFEALVECIIALSPIDKRINLINYAPTPENEYGVDGVGVAHCGSNHCVQIKYASNTNKLLTEGEDSIAMFPAYAKTRYQAEYMTIFTTAKGLHHKLGDFNGTVRTLGYSDISNLLDGNKVFWTLFKKLLDEK